MLSNLLYHLGLSPIGQFSQVSSFGPIIFHGSQSSMNKKMFKNSQQKSIIFSFVQTWIQLLFWKPGVWCKTWSLVYGQQG